MSSAVGEPRVPPSDAVAAFHESLASLCRSGVPLPRAFEMLGGDLSSGPLRESVLALAADLDDGVPFDEAYARRCGTFPPAYAALVSAGMASGDLPGALAEIARHAERRRQVALTFRRALAGPLTTAVFVVAVGALLLATIGPRLREIDATLGGAPSLASLWTFGSGGGGALDARLLVSAVTLALLALLVGVSLLMAWKRSPLDGRAGLATWRLRWPVVGRLRLYAALSCALTTLAALVRRGVPLPEALDLTAQAADEPALRGELVAMAAAAHDGAGLEDAARSAGLLPPSELWLLRAAQERGAPEEGLDDLAGHYTERLDRAVSRATRILVPAAELALGAVVFVLAYTFLVPITQLASRVLGGL